MLFKRAIISILNVRKLLKALYFYKGDIEKFNLDSVLTAPFFSPNSNTLRSQLFAFRKQKRRLALVIDEYGSLQGLVTLLSWAAWSAKGKPFGLDSSAISAMLGGLIAIIPAGLFAIRARLLTKKVIESGVARLAVAGLVTGEIIKIIATIAMFFLVIVFYPDLDWLPLLLTYVLALKCYWLAWILRK